MPLASLLASSQSSCGSSRDVSGTVSQTLRSICADPKHLGAQLGFITILHTWGQNFDGHNGKVKDRDGSTGVVRQKESLVLGGLQTLQLIGELWQRVGVPETQHRVGAH